MRNDSGNVLFLILIGVALFAALQYAMSRGSQVNMTGDRERNSLAADQIIRYGMELQQAVELIMANGHSENQLSFEHPDLNAGYVNANATDETKIFHIAGGGATYQPPKTAWQTTPTDWFFSGQTCIPQVGDYDMDCQANGRSELIAFLPNVTQGICNMINRKAGIGDVIPQDGANAWIASNHFNGVIQTGAVIRDPSNTFSGQKIGCFEGQNIPAAGSYNVYIVLLAR